MEDEDTVSTLTTEGLTVYSGATMDFVLEEDASISPQFRWKFDSSKVQGAFEVDESFEYERNDEEKLGGALGKKIYTVTANKDGGSGTLSLSHFLFDAIEIEIRVIETHDLMPMWGDVPDTVTFEPGEKINFIVEENRSVPPRYWWQFD